MNSTQNTNHSNIRKEIDFRIIGGLLLVIIGIAILLDQYIKTGWLPLIILPFLGLLCIFGGIRLQRFGLVIAGSLLSGIGSGAFLILRGMNSLSWQQRIGYGLLLFSFSWVGVTLFSAFFARNIAWWALIPASLIAGSGIPFAWLKLSIFDFVFWCTISLGLAFLIWGSFKKWIGLLIPGSLLVGIGPGIYYPWRVFDNGNGLTQTGEMLVWFALGWVLMIFFSRIVLNKFIWWPMIPAGVLTMVGWGLYVGGNPQNAVSFIGNSGSIVLIIFGLYLLLLRQGIRK